ncbi:MAG: alpha-amylase family glycosyl hydrolase [Proteobacteria bacterium]|nr:alpha-amylase family glycosyl hydrolase [Pseudomonadota bacterium]
MARYSTMEFHISRTARDRYRFDDTLFSITGNVIFANFHAARIFAQKMNQKRDLANFPEQAVKAGHINAMGLIDEILHHVVKLYCEQVNPEVMGRSLDWLYQRHGQEKVDKALHAFAVEFPTVAVYRQEITVEAYLNETIAGIPNRHLVLEEMLMLWLANMNPAFLPFSELFNDIAIKKETIYLEIISDLKIFIDSQPGFGPDNQNLIDMLRSPAIEVPHSLQGQLEYIRERWGKLIHKFVRRMLSTFDLIKEEEKIPFTGPGPSRRFEFTDLAGLVGLAETERFSPDRDWMPRLILIAKNIYVWLDQLSKKYGHPVTRLDHIPDEELSRLKNQGFTGLWLIGIWERSQVSQKIKQLCGNPDAVPSAYSLFDYVIAADLGGEEAYEILKNRAWEKGIRLASDMVPNHVGIYSKWLIEHPDWFISLDYNPFPWYAFNGQDLSTDERVGINIEDHYYNRTDAAVVFKRTDRWTGSEKYVYHGNDGTSMPWNDTAQLNYLNPEVREAMIRTILYVAGKFPVIRFDAAMTLTKKHYQRLWFPEPGSGGAIPTRAEYGLTKGEFNALMPEEFWREVVDRVAAEAPDTLLLAEAFWLLEGYFVRTLGMHRVYNSAFMNMLRDEDNAGYRAVMKKILEFDPEILRRFVNFMNNPDERTAVDQFGKDNKYFGVCILMATMPGLPMFGHGQIEGFAEKYGMEYRRAYKDEAPDPYLLERHWREIFPLLHMRYLFAGVEYFLLYDFFTNSGYVNEDVFAYSNRFENEASLVVYHNKNDIVSGWIKTSASYSVKKESDNTRELLQKNVGNGLALGTDRGRFTIFRDHISNLEYIRENREIHEKGLYIELGHYTCHVFTDFHEVYDNEWHHYSSLNANLGGLGVVSIEEELKKILMLPMHNSFRDLINADTFRKVSDIYMKSSMQKTKTLPQPFITETAQKIVNFLSEIKKYTGSSGNEKLIADEITHALEIVLQIPALQRSLEATAPETYKKALRYMHRRLVKDQNILHVLCGWLFTFNLGKINKETDYEELSLIWMDELLFWQIMEDTFKNLGFDKEHVSQSLTMIKTLNTCQHWYRATKEEIISSVMEHILSDSDIRQLIQINNYKDVLWFSKEAFEQLLLYMLLIAVINFFTDSQKTETERIGEITGCYNLLKELLLTAEQSGYQVEKMLEILESQLKSQ